MRRKSYKAVPPFFIFTIMRKILFTLLCAANVLNSLAGGSVSLLDKEKLTLEGYRQDGFIPVVTNTDKISSSTWSPCFVNHDKDGKIYSMNGVNENGIVNIAEFRYNADNFNLSNFYQDQAPDDEPSGICIKPQIDYLNLYADEKIDVDFNYLFVINTYNGYDSENRLYQLVNERGDVIFTFPSKSGSFFYSEKLFYISYEYRTGEYSNENCTCEVMNLASLLKDYSTKVASAKADAVNSKSTKIYNIQGMEVDEDTKGIIIENGTKYLKK